ncbi:MAG: hypothetical protein KGR26_13035 [Cyanobacteria bacterium REEB65]|nr:hypothetical protein [Cyanobacteria bacterium REEB65]
MNALEETALADVIDKLIASGNKLLTANALGLVVHCSGGSAVARRWADAHPDIEPGCCIGSAVGGAAYCTCWEPVYNSEQAVPDVAALDGRTIDTLPAQPSPCGDCAFRPGSPERETDFEWETLAELAARDQAFYCHQGMRRPVKYVHPELGEMPGDPDDWQPAQVGMVAFQADGTPALLCAGWKAQRLAVVKQRRRRPGIALPEGRNDT